MKKTLFLGSLLLASSVFAEGYMKKANVVSKDLLKTLGSNMKRELKSHGPEAALKFCSANAYKLTQEIDKQYGKNISVKRISLKPRNPANKATADEAVILKAMENMHKVGAKPKNIMQVQGDVVKVYKPLFISKKACLICHGDVAKAKPALAKAIKNVYPHDQAMGYKMGDLRGAVVVTMPKKK